MNIRSIKLSFCQMMRKNVKLLFQIVMQAMRLTLSYPKNA